MPTIMITGASRGLGLEFARQYGAEGWTVLATCRNPVSVGELATIAGDIQVHGLDVTDHVQIERLANELSGIAMDVLINNAGLYGPRIDNADAVDYDQWRQVMETNVLAPLKVATAFTPHVAAGSLRTIATLTSKMGSIGDNTSGGAYVYRSSKAAVNAVMRSLAWDLKPKGINAILLHPGWVKTDMGGPNASIDAKTSVSSLRRVIASTGPHKAGHFFNYDGAPIPW